MALDSSPSHNEQPSAYINGDHLCIDIEYADQTPHTVTFKNDETITFYDDQGQETTGTVVIKTAKTLSEHMAHFHDIAKDPGKPLIVKLRDGNRISVDPRDTDKYMRELDHALLRFQDMPSEEKPNQEPA